MPGIDADGEGAHHHVQRRFFQGKDVRRKEMDRCGRGQIFQNVQKHLPPGTFAVIHQ